MKDFIQRIKIKYGGDLNCITAKQWEEELEKLVMAQREMPIRKKLPPERASISHHFKIGDLDGYIIVGLYEDGKPAEVFLRMAKIGSTISGLLDNIGLLISLMIQHGIPLKDICEKLAYTRFEPDGYSGNTLGFAKSITDYVARWLQWRFIDGQPERSKDYLGGDNDKLEKQVAGAAEHDSQTPKPDTECIHIGIQSHRNDEQDRRLMSHYQEEEKGPAL